MAPSKVAASKLTLSYPLYACDFDDKDPVRLVVGGGGGSGKTGVGNKITVLDTSNPYEIQQTAEIELSKDEDNVTSLAVGQTRGTATQVYAGINSSPKDVARGVNEHFRVLALESSKGSGQAVGALSEQSRYSVFQRKDKDAYQRITRLSRQIGEGFQLGAVSTGLAKKPEVVLFDATAFPMGSPAIRGRIEMSKEAEDVDLIRASKDQFLLAYCSRKELFVKTIGARATPDDPISVYTIPGVATNSNALSLSIRSFRFITPEFVIMLVNIDGREGALLQILRLPSASMPQARIALQKRLPAKVVQGTGLAVSCLSPDSWLTEGAGFAQFTVAVASQVSLTLYTFDYSSQHGVAVVANMDLRKSFSTVHPVQITGVALSAPITRTEMSSQPVLKMASVSVGNTIVVQTIPLTSTTIGATAERPRYLVSLAADPRSPAFFIVLGLLVAVLSVLTQGFLEIRDQAPEIMGAKRYLSPHTQALLRPVPGVAPITETLWDDIRNLIFPPSISRATESITIATTTSTSSTAIVPSATSPTDPDLSPRDPAPLLADSLAALLATPQANPQHLIYLREEQDAVEHETSPELARTNSLKADLHDESVQGPPVGGKRWEELTQEQKTYWTGKLADLGHDVESLGLTILKGIVFGEAGTAIGNVVGG